MFDGQTTAGVSDTVNIASFRNQIFSIFIAGTTPDVTVKVRISGQEDYPDLTSASDADNIWTYADIAMVNNAGSITDGDTGLVVSTAGAYQFEVNQNGYTWLALELIGADIASTVTAKLALTSNQ